MRDRSPSYQGKDKSFSILRRSNTGGYSGRSCIVWKVKPVGLAASVFVRSKRRKPGDSDRTAFKILLPGQPRLFTVLSLYGNIR